MKLLLDERSLKNKNFEKSFEKPKEESKAWTSLLNDPGLIGGKPEDGRNGSCLQT